jgi:hypothetical protein
VQGMIDRRVQPVQLVSPFGQQPLAWGITRGHTPCLVLQRWV